MNPTQPLPRRPLGRNGPDVTVLGFGSAPLGDLYTRLDDLTAIQAVAAALDAGMTLFDTSPHYGNGLAEHRCGTALRRVPRESVVISTKVGRVMDPHTAPVRVTREGVISPGFAGGLPHAASFDYSYDGTMRSLEQSLLRLGTDRVDVLLIHDADVWTHGDEADARFREAMDGAYRALDRLRADGTVKAIGVGINEADTSARFARAGDFDVVLLAGRYSLLEQPALDEFMPLAEEKGISVMLGGVFNSGILATGPVEDARYDYAPAPPEIIDRVGRIAAICRAHGIALPHAAVQFALAHPAVCSLVLGAVTPGEVHRNRAALATPAPAGLWADLKSQGLLREDAPVPG
ncbi:aldo/keto reductase [Microbaculum marinum]|uniref:Aldo/keto reductase n=1 Tax=Microbaculum marinum TaxID=1764581 RepID=A0AAW9S2E4_9HYPH